MNASLLNTISTSVASTVRGSAVREASSVSTDTEFSHSFLAQIKTLQKSGEIPKDIRESKDFQKMTRLIADSDGQSVSALLGEKLPQIKEVKDINLDKTMTALQNILGQLETLSKNTKEITKNPKLSNIDKSEGQEGKGNKEDGAALLLDINQLPVISEQKSQSPISLTDKTSTSSDDTGQLDSVATEDIALQATVASKIETKSDTKIENSKEKGDVSLNGKTSISSDDTGQLDSSVTEVVALQAAVASKVESKSDTKIEKSKEKADVSLNGKISTPSDNIGQLDPATTEDIALQAAVASKVESKSDTKIEKSKEKADVSLNGKISAPSNNIGQLDPATTEDIALQAAVASKVESKSDTKIEKSKEKADVSLNRKTSTSSDDTGQLDPATTEVVALQAAVASKVESKSDTKIEKSKEKADVSLNGKISTPSDDTGQLNSATTEGIALQAAVISKTETKPDTKTEEPKEKGNVTKPSTDKINKEQDPLAAIINLSTLPVIEQSQQAGRVMPQVLRQTNSLIDDKKQSAVISSLTTVVEEEGLKPKVNIANLLKRESLLSKTQIETPEFKMDALTSKILDTQALNTSQSSDLASQKFTAIDLNALNRQIEGTVAKIELPPMTKPFNHPEWKQEFNERIVWMNNKNISSAELRLNPNNLGPISIAIKMDQDQQASIQIQAHHAGVRDAIESSIPRLREMLNTQQINLSDVNVSQQQQQGQGSARQAMQDALNERAGNTSENHGAEEGGHTSTISDEINQGRIIASKGLLSLYA